MDLATQQHLATLRDLLAYRQRELQADVHAAAQAQRDASGGAQHEVMDQKDMAAQREGSQLLGRQEQRDLDELRDVDAALQRLHDGCYGDCCDCDEPIAMPRLLAQPAALRCATCQQAHEDRQTGTARRALGHA